MRDFYGERPTHVMPRIGGAYCPPQYGASRLPGIEREDGWESRRQHEQFSGNYTESTGLWNAEPQYGESAPLRGRQALRHSRGRFYGVGPKGYVRRDERIEEEIIQRLTEEGNADLRDVRIKVSGGEVELTGKVVDLDTKYRVEEIAADVLGVREVDNRLKVRRRAGQTEQHAHVLYGILESRQDTERAVSELQRAGFDPQDISVLFPSPDTTKEFAHHRATKAPEQAVVGMSSGALLGGALGWLLGIGTIAIPGLGAVVAAGPIIGMLAGAGAGGAIGGIAGALSGAGVPEFEAKRYEGRIAEGGILMAVHCHHREDIDHARDILLGCHAKDISTVESDEAD